MIARTAAAVALLLLMTSSAGHAQLRNFRNKSGVRLQHGVGPKGRVELSSVNAWFNNYSTSPVKPTFNAVCDDDFDDSLALIMCTLLGYTYGRKSYDPKFNYKKTTSNNSPIGRINCMERIPAIGRRLRSGADGEAALDLSGIRPSRSLFGPEFGTLNTPSRSPYICNFVAGKCNSTGPLAGIECSHTPMPAAPPPPPSPPPSPLPPPPSSSSFSSSILLVGGRPNDMPDASPEPNVECRAGGPSCESFGRMELLISGPAGSSAAQVWAPLCAIADDLLASSVRFVACQQILDWPEPQSGIVVTTPDENLSFVVPTAPPSVPGHFNTSKYGGWVTVQRSSATIESPRRVQDFVFTVSATPCTHMLAVQCMVLNFSG